MRPTSFLADGFRLATRRPWLALPIYLVPLLLALPIARIARNVFGQAFDHRPFADRILSGDALAVLPDMGPGSPWLGLAISLAIVAAAVLHVLVAAGVVSALLDHSRGVLAGVAENAGRFARSALWFLLASVLAAGCVGAIAAVLFKLAESRADGRLDLVAAAVAGVLAFVLLGPLHLAYDLARIAAARHDDGAMLRGFGRALVAVLRRPGTAYSLAALFVATPVALSLLALKVLPAQPHGVLGVLGLAIVPQLAFATRAFATLGFWGTEIEWYQALGEPRFCQRRERRRPAVEAVPIAVNLLDPDQPVAVEGDTVPPPIVEVDTPPPPTTESA
jgi:hypothetical protein